MLAPSGFDPAAPAVLSTVPFGDREVPDDARSVSVLFQFSRPNPVEAHAPRLPPRGLAAVANGADGLALVGLTRNAWSPSTPASWGLLLLLLGFVLLVVGVIVNLRGAPRLSRPA